MANRALRVAGAAVALLGIALLLSGPLLFNEFIAPALPSEWVEPHDDGTWGARWDVEVPLAGLWFVGGALLAMFGVLTFAGLWDD